VRGHSHSAKPGEIEVRFKMQQRGASTRKRESLFVCFEQTQTQGEKFLTSRKQQIEGEGRGQHHLLVKEKYERI